MMQRVLEFLLSLERVKLTPNSHFSFVWNYPALIILGMLALGTLGYLTYLRQAASPRKRITMGLVRAALLAFVFMLIWRPEVVVEHEERTRSVVAVWLDDSASMTLEDPYKDPSMRAFVQQAALNEPVPPGQSRMNRYQLATATLQNAQWLKDLTASQDIAFYTGAGHAQLLGTAHTPDQIQPLLQQLQSGAPAGETTDVPAILQEILQGAQGQRISAVLLLTDGQTTERGSRIDQALAAAQRAGAKIFPLPLGQAQEPFDLKLANLQVPENTFVRDPVAVRTELSATGIDAPMPVKITIYRKQSEALTPLATKEFTLDPAKKTINAELIFKPEKKTADKAETFDLVARVEPAGPTPTDELTLQNNTVTGQTRILDAQINVLYVDGYPRWEFRYLKNELIREKTVNVASLLLSADDDFAQEGDPRVIGPDGRETFPGPISRFPETAAELAKFDVLFLGDVDPAYFSPTQQRLIVDFVGNGGGIGWIAGTAWDPEAYKGTPLDVLLPIIPDELDPRARVMAPPDNAPFNLVLTAAGRDSNLFRFFDDADLNVKQMAELPEMYWYKPIVGLAPAAEVLAVHPTRSQGGNPMPLLVTGHYKRGRTLFSGICDTWRWRRYMGEPLFQSYWLQVCRLLYRNKAMGQSQRLELAAETNRVEIGRPLKVSLTVKDPTLLGQMPPQIPVLITGDKNIPIETVMLQRAAGPANSGQENFEGVTTATQIGDVRLTIPPGTLPIDVPPYPVTIKPPQREFEKITADIPALMTLAANTTGAIIPINHADTLAKQIPDRSIPVLISSSEELWYKPIALLLVVLLATLEWLLRKNAGLI